jgi:FMN-dependent NADH-azoreductase
MGMSDVETIRIEGVNMGGEGVEKAVAAAQQKARELTLAA